MSCEHCTDPEGSPCFPTHGLAPHRHTEKAHVFDLSPTPGFTPDADDPTQGTWWCVHCGDGKPEDTPIESEKTPFGGKDDPLYEQAVMIVRANRRPSISMVQRHLAIGYNRASLMLEAMVGTVLDGPGPNAKFLPVNAETKS